MMEDESAIDDPKERKIGSLNIYQYDAQLALAFQTDCEEFFNKFSRLESYSFATFANLWRQTCFLSIFEKEEYVLMLKAFIANCFLVVKKFLFSSNLYVQAGAVYMLYGLYYKQPIKEFVKIRLTQLETDKINDIVNTHKRQKRLEIVYIFNKMRLDGAFQFCALIEPQSLNAKHLFDQTNENVIQKTHTIESPLKKFRSLIEEDPILQDLQKTDYEYQNLANKYKNKCKQLYVFPSSITEEIKTAYLNVEEAGNVEEREDNPEETSPLKEIKKRAMSNTRATYRAERRIVTDSCSK